MTDNKAAGWVDESALRTLGLKRQPFDPAQGSFYEDANRARQLNAARRQLRAGGVVVVSGAAGIGKTAFLNWLCASTYDPAITPIDAQADCRVSDIVDAAAPHHKGDGPVSPWVVLRDASPQPAVAVDNGQRLPTSLIKRLARLQGALADNGLALPVVISCDTAEAEALYATFRANAHPEVGLESIALAPFESSDTAAYLRLRLAEASGDDTALTERQIKRIHRRSGGHPDRIHTEAARALERTARRSWLSAALPSLPAEKRPRHAALAFGIAAVGSAGALFWWDGGGPSRDSATVTRIEVPTEPVAAAQPSREAPSGDSANERSEAPAQGSEETTQATASATDNQPWDARSADNDAGLEPVVAREAKADREETETKGAESDNPSQSARENGDATAGQNIDRLAIGDRKEAASETSTSRGDGTSPVTAREADLPEFQLDTQWFSNREPDHFTIQVLGARKPLTVRRFLGAAGEDNELRVVLSQKDGNPWYAIVTGDYADRSSATEAIKQLPPDWRDRDPFPRTFASLQPGG